MLRFEGDAPELPDIPGLLNVTAFGNEMRVTAVSENGVVEEQLRKLNGVDLQPVAVGMEDAVVSYMDERGRRRSLLHTIGSPEH